MVGIGPMAAAAQALRFLVPGSAAGGGSFDAFNRIVADLCTSGNPKVPYRGFFLFFSLFKVLVGFLF